MRSRLAEVQEDVQPFDLPGAAEERRAGGRVEVEAVPGPAGAVRPGHHQPGRPLAVHHDRHLAGGVPERAGGQLDRVWRTGHVQVPERARLGQELAAPEQVDPETYPAPLDGKAHLAEPGDDVLLDLSGHARLLGPGEPWRVRVRVGRDRTVYLRRLVYADAVAYRLVVRADPGQGQHVGAAVPAGPVEYLVDGQQQLGHHVPVDAAEALVLVEGSRPAGERLVVEDLLVQVEQVRGIRGDQLAQVVVGHGAQRGTQVAGVAEGGVEVQAAVDVADHDPAVAAPDQLGQQRRALDRGGRDDVLLQEAR